ncbi:glutaredoxin [Athelia psychrophila]|uniref:Monothiol glutaredoxin-5, mitochondrial n=1 Tax=Athelia psychrophila TaxID=1759441 RepID=A0A166TDR0_9AGAM|nr:glutaredoxin [Fibularhizoctonia sp. CBS 109695]
MLRSAIRSSIPAFRAHQAARLLTPTFARFLSQQARTQIEGAVKASPVVLFMKGTPAMPQCGFSRAAIQVLDLHGVPPEKMKTFDVLEDQELRNGIKEFSDWPTIPQLYVGGEFVGGCDILLGMHQSGELATLLESNDIIPKAPAEAEVVSST